MVDPFGLCGRLIDGQFRVDTLVGEGGFSIVYKGFHMGLNVPVALKCLKLASYLEPEMAESFGKRFRDESRLAYRLSQGNLDIVRSIAAGTTVSPTTHLMVPYMVLEWLEGKSLAADLRERRARGLKGRPIEEVVNLFQPAVDAIQYAHSQDVVHRDLKPGNLFLAQDYHYGTRMKVLDFGLAKILGQGVGFAPSVQTVGDSTICSPSYGAPEQFDPNVGPVGPWTDVYALALLVMECLRDQKVRSGDGLAQCAVQALDPNPPTCHALGIKVRPQIEVALARALSLDPKARPRSALEFWTPIKDAAAKRRSGRPPDMDATVFDPNAGKHHESDLGATVQRDQPVPRAAFRSAPENALASTMVMSDSVKAAQAAAAARAGSSRPPPDRSPAALAATIASDRPPPPQPAMPHAATQAWPEGSFPQAAQPPPPPQPAPPPAQNVPYYYGQHAPISPAAYTHVEVSRPVSKPAAPKKKSRAGTVILILFLVLLVLGGGGFALYWFVLLPRGIVPPLF